MNRQTFDSLSLKERTVLTWVEGTLLGVCAREGHGCALYHLNGFFVELRYGLCGEEVLSARGFTDPGQLEPYLERIELP